MRDVVESACPGDYLYDDLPWLRDTVAATLDAGELDTGNPGGIVPGDRVSLEPGVPDLSCEQCLAGRYNLCEDMRFHATPPYDGSFAGAVTMRDALAQSRKKRGFRLLHATCGGGGTSGARRWSPGRWSAATS